jgi:hypothetical protein
VCLLRGLSVCMLIVCDQAGPSGTNVLLSSLSAITIGDLMHLLLSYTSS